MRISNRDQRSIIRLGVLLLLFDVYLTWARIEKSATATSSFLSRTPIIVQYLFFLTLNALATLAHHLTVRTLSYVFVPRCVPASAGRTNTTVTESVVSTSGQPHSATSPSSSRLSQHEPSLASASSPCLPAGTSATNKTAGTTNPHAHAPSSPLLQPPPLRRVSTAPSLNVKPLPPPTPASPTAISTALLVSSCAKLFPILLVIWGQDGSSSSSSSSNNKSVSTTYPQSHAFTHIENTPSLLFARQHDIATPVATVISPSTPQLSLPGPPDYPDPGLDESASVFETWITGLISTLPLSSSANHYLALVSEFVGSLLSLGAADTHLVLLSNIEALYILLGCGYLPAVALAVAGLAARWTVQRVVLSAVGVG